MKKHTTTFGVGSEQLARLLGIGLDLDDHEHCSPNQAKAALLRTRLSGTLPLDPAVVDALPAILGRVCRELLPMGGRSLGGVLLDSETGLDVLETIKDYGKKLVAGKDSEAEHAVSTAIYFAAIASALLFHDQKITSYTYPALAEAFSTLIDKQWLAPELARHLAKARRLCIKNSS